MDRPSPETKADRDFVETLIFSLIFAGDSTVVGCTSVTDFFVAASLTLFLCARCFSRAIAMLQNTEYQIKLAVIIDVPVFPEHMFPSLLDLPNTSHSLDSSLYEVPIVTYRYVSSLLKVNRRVLSKEK